MKGKENRKQNKSKVITPVGTNEIDFNQTLFLNKNINKYEGLLKSIANENILFIAFKNIIKKKEYFFNEIKDEIFLANKKIFMNLSKEIGSGSYQPNLTKKIIIPKLNDNLGFSCSVDKDKVIQEAMRIILEFIFESEFSENSHGFRQKKNVHTALNQYKKQFKVVI